jgi:hypothetical protein
MYGWLVAIVMMKAYWSHGGKSILSSFAFARPAPRDEPPVINGDPFTDSQEYPSGFTLGTILRAGSRATVPVRFDEGGRYKVVEYRLQLSGTTWRVDDLHYPDGATFRGLLKPAKR